MQYTNVNKFPLSNLAKGRTAVLLPLAAASAFVRRRRVRRAGTFWSVYPPESFSSSSSSPSSSYNHHHDHHRPHQRAWKYTYSEMSDGLEAGLEWRRNFNITRVEKELDGVEPLSNDRVVAQWMLKPPPGNSHQSSTPVIHQLNKVFQSQVFNRPWYSPQTQVDSSMQTFIPIGSA